MLLRRLSLPGSEAFCWHEFTFFSELSAYRQPERVAQFSPDWLHWTGFQAQNDDLIVKREEDHVHSLVLYRDLLDLSTLSLQLLESIEYERRNTAHELPIIGLRS